MSNHYIQSQENKEMASQRSFDPLNRIVLHFIRDVIIIAKTDEFVVVDKPSTMVVHPTGSSRYNSLQTILELRFNRKLYTIHRLDRVTSGICLFAKSPEAAQNWSNNLERSQVHKYYLARVKGKFSLCFHAVDAAVPRLPWNKNGIASGEYSTVPAFV